MKADVISGCLLLKNLNQIEHLPPETPEYKNLCILRQNLPATLTKLFRFRDDAEEKAEPTVGNFNWLALVLGLSLHHKSVSACFQKIIRRMYDLLQLILLMVQKSGDHQLRLGSVYPIIYNGF